MKHLLLIFLLTISSSYAAKPTVRHYPQEWFQIGLPFENAKLVSAVSALDDPECQVLLWYRLDNSLIGVCFDENSQLTKTIGE